MKLCFRGDVNGVLFDSCSLPCFKILRRLLKISSIPNSTVVQFFWDKSIERLSSALVDQLDDKLDSSRINYGELLRICLQAMNYNVFLEVTCSDFFYWLAIMHSP